MEKSIGTVTLYQSIPLQQFITYRMSRVQAKLNMQASQILKEKGNVTLNQWRIILLIGKEDATTQAKIAKKSDFDKGLLSRQIKTLIADGYVATKIDSSDSRQHILNLTDKGKAVYDTVLPYMNARQRHLLASLNDQEQELVFGILEKIEKAANVTDFDL